MGMYTEFYFNAKLKDALPDIVVDVLDTMMGHKAEMPGHLPDHPLFSCRMWEHMLRSDSFYFDSVTCSFISDKVRRYTEKPFTELRKKVGDPWFYLNIKCNLKNYEEEIEKFIDWIRPYLDKDEGEFLGFHRYEESEEPVLVYA